MSAPRVRSILIAVRRPFAGLSFLPPLVTRLVLGHAYYQAGIGKWTHFDNAVTLFAAVGLPLPEQSVFLVSRLETFGGIALAVGLLTRPTAAVLAIVMTVALATADLPRLVEALGPDRTFGPADITSFVFLLLLSWLVAYGPGAASVDRLLIRAAQHLFSVRRREVAVAPLSQTPAPALTPGVVAGAGTSSQPTGTGATASSALADTLPQMQRPQEETLRPQVLHRNRRQRRR